MKARLLDADAGRAKIRRGYNRRAPPQRLGLSGGHVRPGHFRKSALVTARSSVDGSRVARGKLTQWHWSGAVFCPACWCSQLRLLALMVSANKAPFCFSGYDALDIAWVVPVPGLTGLPSHRIALATSW